MKTTIILSQLERETITRTIEILEEYSRIWSAAIYGKGGMHVDNAATAAGLLKAVIKEDER